MNDRPTDDPFEPSDQAGLGDTDFAPFDHEHSAGDTDPPPPEVDESLATVSHIGSVDPTEELPPSVEDLLDEAAELVQSAKSAPMSSLVKVSREDLLEIFDEAKVALPEELRAARWLLREKADFLAGARREREEIIEQGRLQVARMIERQEVIRAAEAKARQIVEEARSEARITKRQVEDFCDRKLATFERVLEQTMTTVNDGRAKLAASTDLNDVDLRDDHPERVGRRSGTVSP